MPTFFKNYAFYKSGYTRMSPIIAILLSTYNGTTYLEALMKSLEEQTSDAFILIIRDDGSSDDTFKILQKITAKTKLSATLLPQTENIGVKKSFSKLLSYALEHTSCNYFMFCDQDDIWLPEKIAHTLEKMHSLETDNDLPVLVHTDLQVVDEHLHRIAPSFWKYEKIDPSKNALNRLLMHNTITGCTLMINRSLAIKSLPIPDECIMHDWWIGLVCSAFGTIGYLEEATVLYRQHGGNDTGAKPFSYAKLPAKIFDILLHDTLYDTLNRNLLQAATFLECYRNELDSQSLEILTAFTTLKEQACVQKRFSLLKYRLFKNGVIRNTALLLRV